MEKLAFLLYLSGVASLQVGGRGVVGLLGNAPLGGRGVVGRAACVRMQDDAASSGPSPEEWRDFRQRLVSGGIKLTTDEATAPADDAALGVEPRKAVAPGNEALLRSQNEGLYQEYINGCWAHESPMEAGGLLLRMPLEAQLTHFLRGGAGDDDSSLCEELRSRLRKELPPPEEGADQKGDERFDSWSANTPYCYRLCERFVEETLAKLAAQVPMDFLVVFFVSIVRPQPCCVRVRVF